MKSVRLLLLMGTAGVMLACSGGQVHYLASKKSPVFHRSNCGEAGHIKPENRIEFAHREQAAAGHRPCDVCKP